MKKMFNFLLTCMLCLSLMPIQAQAKDSQLKLAYGDLVTYGTWNNEQLIWQVANISDNKAYLITYDLLRKKGQYPWSRPVFSMGMDYPELDRMNEPNGFPYLGEKTAINTITTGYSLIRKGDPTTVLNTYTGSVMQNWLNHDSGGFDARVFTANQKKAILKTKMADEQYPNTRSWEGYAFLPSASEIEEYDILNLKTPTSGVLDPESEAAQEKLGQIGAATGMHASSGPTPIEYAQRWWTRTPSDMFQHMVIGYGTIRLSAEFTYQDYEGAVGVRPCINLDLDLVKSKAGNGTIEAPYQLVPLKVGTPEETLKPPTEKPVIKPDEKPQEKPEEKPQEPKDEMGTDTVTTIKDRYEKNNHLGDDAKAANFPLYINGNKITLSAQPMLIKGTTYLPVRELAGLLGLKVDYDEKEDVAILEDKKTGNRLDLPLGYKHALHNGTVVPVDANDAAKGIPFINGRSYLPLRFVTTRLGYSIDFKDNSIYIGGQSPELF